MPTSPALAYFPVLVQILLGITVAAGMIVSSYFLGRKIKNKVKDQVYECGVTPKGDARDRFSVKFYLVAMLFILFDIEAIFLYPWVVVFREMRMAAFFEMLLFMVLVLAGFFYIWKKGVLHWATDSVQTPDEPASKRLEAAGILTKV